MWRLASVRVRTTLAAIMIVGIALLAGAVFLVGAQRRALTRDVEAAAQARANDLATILRDGALPKDLSVTHDDQAIVQVLDGRRTVVAASRNITGEAPISQLRAPSRGVEFSTLARSPVADTGFRLVARQVQMTARRPYTIYVGMSLAPVHDGTTSLATLLAVGVPFLVGLVGLTTWVVAGRTLRPVEQIRAEVEGIRGGDLDRRVPEPRTHDEVGRLAATMNEMLDRIESSADRQRRFVDDASHELRSPLAALRSALEVELAGNPSPERRPVDRDMLVTTVRMQRLVDDLLVLAQADAGRLPVRRTTVDLDDVVLQEVRAARLTTTLTIDSGTVSGGQVMGDREQLSRAVRNLIENAVRHGRARVDVTLAERDGVVSLVVADDGPGIPAEARARIFERFARLDESRDRERGGVGLGLAIVHDIVAVHGGSIVVEDAQPGARFTVDLPATMPGAFPAEPGASPRQDSPDLAAP